MCYLGITYVHCLLPMCIVSQNLVLKSESNLYLSVLKIRANRFVICDVKNKDMSHKN